MSVDPARLGRRFVVGAISAGLSGCGFRPVYGPGGAAGGPQTELAAIDVALIPDRAGQLLRQFLQQRLDRGEGVVKRYSLSVSYYIAADAIAIQTDSTSTRIRDIGNATWTLKALNPAQTTIVNGTARALDGVNVIDQQYFAADLAGEAAIRRIGEAIANQITLQIASYFTRHPAAT